MNHLALTKINDRLKIAQTGVRIQQVSNRLYLRATLPPKPNSTKTKPYQQRIALGIYASDEGLKRAEAEARLLGGLIACKNFRWDAYLKAPPDEFLPVETIEVLIQRFEKYYFQTRERNQQTQTTWLIDYWRIFKKLPQTEVLLPDNILEVVTATVPDSKTRKRTCMALSAIARFAQVEVNLKPYKGRYSPRLVTPRDLPTDTTIAKTFYEIESEAWRWVYGMLATYGLRNHEVFRLDFVALANGNYIVSIGENSKTGSRRVWPCYPEWFAEFGLQNVRLPQVDLNQSNAAIGHVVTVWFRRHQIPFAPYNLRHCWAVRALEFGLDISLAAQQMGHSAKVHSELYHHWISEKHHQRAFELMTNKSDRPLVPKILGHQNGVKSFD
ncbi:site-specific integrase [Nostoc sp.]|uniref:site-specific integrase n=1 Tax=Nostoc sp. TaxID=1180 RepID=UPI002FF5BB4F